MANNLAKNTGILYLRMIVVLVVSLFTTRIILQNLGIDDYGLYNVIGSIVSLFYFLQIAFSSSSYRYLTFAIGKRDTELLITTFKSSLILAIVVCIFILILGESIGTYYVNNFLILYGNKSFEANVVFQISLITSVVLTLITPFYSVVISHEKMTFFAWISIIEVISKVGIALSISMAPINKMIYYASLLLVTQIVILIVYVTYCYKRFVEVRGINQAPFDKNITIKMSSFSGWTLFVAISDLVVLQGLNIMLNRFFEPFVNAARGIAVQVQGAVDNFRANLQTALNPQITKRFAANEINSMLNLMSCSTRFSTYVLLLVSLPIIFCRNEILRIWLETVPNYTASFIVIVLFACIIDGMSNPFVTAVGATGEIKKFQIVVGLIKISCLPACYIGAKLTMSPVVIMLLYALGTAITVFVRIKLFASEFKISFGILYKQMFNPIILVSVFGITLGYTLSLIISVDSFFTTASYVIIFVIVFLPGCFYLGLFREERFLAIKLIKKTIDNVIVSIHKKNCNKNIKN